MYEGVKTCLVNLANVSVMILIYGYTFYRFSANWMSYSGFHDSPEGAVYFPETLLLQSTSHVYQGLYSRIFYVSILVSPRLPVQWKLSWADTLVTRKRCPYLELAAYGNVKIQSLYESWEKRGFVKVALTRAVLLRGCLLGEPPLYKVLMLLAL